MRFKTYLEETLQEANLPKGHAFEDIEIGDKIYIHRRKMKATVVDIRKLSLIVDLENGKQIRLGLLADFDQLQESWMRKPGEPYNPNLAKLSSRMSELCDLNEEWDKEASEKFLNTTGIDVNKEGAFDKIKAELAKKDIDPKYLDGMTANIIDKVKGTTKWRGEDDKD
jgi:hypothetical protein